MSLHVSVSCCGVATAMRTDYLRVMLLEVPTRKVLALNSADICW